MRIVSAAVAALLLFSGVASATPSRGVTAREIAKWSVGDRDYVVREITVAPGGSTGWHHHDGTLYAVVKKGVLTRTMSDCTTNFVHHRGDALIEEPHHVHIGRDDEQLVAPVRHAALEKRRDSLLQHMVVLPV